MIRTINNNTDYPVKVQFLGHSIDLLPRRYYNSEIFHFLTPGEWGRLSLMDFKINDPNIIMLNLIVKSHLGHSWQEVHLITAVQKKEMDILYQR
jgi:hypothetical protein